MSVVVCDTSMRAERLIENLPSIPTLRHIVVLNPDGELESLRSKAGRELDIIPLEELLVIWF